jgi:hypothetical protein
MSQWNEFLQQLQLAFGDDGNFYFRSVTWKGIDLEIDCSIAIVGEAQLSHWLLTCYGLMAYDILGEYPSSSLGIYFPRGGVYYGKDHPLLWPFNSRRVQLYFKRDVDAEFTPERLAGALYLTHMEQVGSWISFDRFLNKSFLSLRDLLSGTHGMLAEGPLPLMEAYHDTLINHGLGANIIDAEPPSHQRIVYNEDPNSTHFVAMTEEGSVTLLVLGDATSSLENFQLPEEQKRQLVCGGLLVHKLSSDR